MAAAGDPSGRPLRELANELADVASTDPDSVYRSLAAVPGEAPMLTGGRAGIKSVAFSPDGHTLASGSGRPS